MFGFLRRLFGGNDDADDAKEDGIVLRIQADPPDADGGGMVRWKSAMQAPVADGRRVKIEYSGEQPRGPEFDAWAEKLPKFIADMQAMIDSGRLEECAIGMAQLAAKQQQERA